MYYLYHTNLIVRIKTLNLIAISEEKKLTVLIRVFLTLRLVFEIHLNLSKRRLSWETEKGEKSL
jgi:hypothetical protein